MTTQQIVDLLNDAFKIDPQAIDCLLCACAPCNRAMIDHPSIITWAKNEKGDFPTLRFLGLLNGIAAIDGDVIVSHYDDDTHCLTHFSLRKKLVTS